MARNELHIPNAMAIPAFVFRSSCKSSSRRLFLSFIRCAATAPANAPAHEPIKAIVNSEFTKFLKTSIKELETKVEKAVFDWELERQERKEFERRAKQNQKLVNALEREADIEAAQTFSRLSQRAKQKAMRQ